MRYKKELETLFFILALGFLLISLRFTLSGGVINVNTPVSVNFFIGLFFLLIGFIIMAQGEGLEYLVIPHSGRQWQTSRSKSAKDLLERRNIKRVVITGAIEHEKEMYKDKSRPSFYRVIRDAGISPKDIKLLRGKDSEEDILYLGKMVNSGDTVYFDTFPLHYQEYKTLVRKAQRDRKFPKGVYLRNARIPQGRIEITYGILGWLEELIKRRPLDYKENRPNDTLDKVKGIVKKIIGV